MSFNDADVAANRAISAAHIHTIPTTEAAGTIEASYAIPPTSGSRGTFFLQCGSVLESQPFSTTPTPPGTALGLHALIGYLDAAARADCSEAETFVLPTPSHAGDVCAAPKSADRLVFDRWRGPVGRPVRSRSTVEFSVELHLTQAPLAGGTDRPGWTTWFLEFRKTGTAWLLDNGGTGP